MLGPCLAGGNLRIADALARRLQELVATRQIPPGTRLPTHRRLADLLEIAPGTVQAAYRKAAEAGVLRSHVGAGTFALDARLPNPGSEGHRLVCEPVPEMVDLSLNAPVDIGQDQALGTALSEIAADTARLSLLVRYQSESGLAEHREAAAGWLRGLGVTCAASEIVITAGAQHALLCTLLGMVRPGEAIAVESCTYPGIVALARYLSLPLKPVATDEKGIVPESLDALCRSNAIRVLYCMPTVQNPTSMVMPEPRRREIAEVVRRHNILAIEDDVHGSLVVDRPVTLQSLAPEYTVYISSFSKGLSSGLRVGFAVMPSATARARVLAATRSTCWVVSPLLAEVAMRWIVSGAAERLLAAQRAEVHRRRRIVAPYLEGIDCRTHCDCFHYWIPLGASAEDADVGDALKEHGVNVLHAASFAIERDQACAAIRVSVSGPGSDAALTRGFAVVRDVLNRGPGLGLKHM